jgi:hypothetical protein
MVKCPIDKLPRQEKREAIESWAQYLRRELGALSFERIIVVGKGSFETARRKLNPSLDPSSSLCHSVHREMSRATWKS